jgi:hypothetical protein
MKSQAKSGARLSWWTNCGQVIYTNSVPCIDANMYPLYIESRKVIRTDDVPCTMRDLHSVSPQLDVRKSE